MRSVLVVGLALAVGCGSAPGSVDAVGPDAARPDAAGAVDAPAAACAGKAGQPLDQTWTLAFGGVDRTIRLHVPASYDPTRPAPVVLAFHGYTLSGQIMLDQARLAAASDADGFVVAAADGTGVLRGWNAGDCCGDPVLAGTDDVGFVGALLDRMIDELCIDEDRVYATGFSNGGFLSHRLGCELADRIAAVAPVSGVMGIDNCNPIRPVPVLAIHGTGDLVVPYDGGGVTGFRSVAETIAGWTARDVCPPGAPIQTYAMGDAVCEAHTGCAEGTEVALCTIDGGGHQWPGGTPLPGGGPTSTDLDATAAIWSFFAAHPRAP